VAFFVSLKMKSHLLLCALVIAGLFPVSAWSQSTPPEPQPQSGSDPSGDPSSANSQQGAPAHHMNATWTDGLVLESDNGDYRIQFGAFMRFDGRFATNAQQNGVPNTFLIRTLRATFQGRLAHYLTFRIQPDFVSKDASLADAWADIAFSKAVHLRVGRYKIPIGLEVLLQDSNRFYRTWIDGQPDAAPRYRRSAAWGSN
jgi:Phosphate-selective porin O and P